MRIPAAPIRVTLTTVVAIGSLLYGLLAMMSPMMFATDEPTSRWIGAFIPVALTVPAVASYWFPRFGVAAYATLLAIAVAIDASPWDARWRWAGGWGQFVLGWTPDIVAVLLLAVSAWLARAKTSADARSDLA